MEMRKLGGSGLSAPPLMLGGNVFGWTTDEKRSHAVLDAFVAGGGSLIDTADAYAAFAPGCKGGESETVIGSWLKARGRRDDVLIATKVGWPWGFGEGLKPDYIAKSVEGSLKRLNTDHIDIYFAHKDDTDTPLEATLEAFDRLIRAGKVRAIGASNYSAARLEEALDVSEARGLARYTVAEPLYNLIDRQDFESGLQKLCVSRNVAAVPYFGLASGFLTGKYRSKADIKDNPRAFMLESYVTERGFGVLKAMDEVAEDAGASLAQVALAWLIAQPGVAAPIASATSVTQVEELVEAMTLKLTPPQLDRLDRASAPVTAA